MHTRMSSVALYIDYRISDTFSYCILRVGKLGTESYVATRVSSRRLLSQLQITGIKVETQYVENADEPNYSRLKHQILTRLFTIPMGLQNSPILIFISSTSTALDLILQTFHCFRTLYRQVILCVECETKSALAYCWVSLI